MMIKTITKCLLACLIFMLTAQAGGEIPEKKREGAPSKSGVKEKQMSVKGEVSLADLKESILVIKSKKALDTLRIGKSTEILHNGKKVKFYRIQAKSKVSAKFVKKDGINEALQVKLLVTPPANRQKAKDKK